MAKRTPIKELPFVVDLTIPINTKDVKFKTMQSCFGKMWDITVRDCMLCAAKDICGIVFKDLVDQKAKALEKEIGSKFLDEADLDLLTDSNILETIEPGVTTTGKLVATCMQLSKCDDKKAIVNFLKRWITQKKLVHTKKGIVWIR